MKNYISIITTVLYTLYNGVIVLFNLHECALVPFIFSKTLDLFCTFFSFLTFHILNGFVLVPTRLEKVEEESYRDR